MNASIEAFNAFAPSVFKSFVWPMLWQSSLLIALVLGLDLALRRKLRPSVRYALWLVVLVKLVLPPSLALPTGLGWWVRPSTAMPAPAKAVAPVRVTYGPAAAPVDLSAQIAPLPIAPPRVTVSQAGWVILAWSGVSFSLLAFMLLRWRQVAQKVRKSSPPQKCLTECVDEARRSIGRRRAVRIRLFSGPMSPAVYGLFRPEILLPESLASRLAPAQLRAVVLHELIHLRRGDVWVNCAQALLQIVYWWHPLLWLANARIRRVREEAVDDAVMLALRDDAETYATTLLEVAKFAFRRPFTALGLVGILESRTSLRQRIERLIDFHPPRKAGLTLVSALCVASFAALALPMGEAPVSNVGATVANGAILTNSPPSTPLYTRLFEVDTNALAAALRAKGLQAGGAPAAKQQAVRDFAMTLGVNLAPPKVSFFSGVHGTLLVRASLSELDRLEAALRKTSVLVELPTSGRRFEGQASSAAAIRSSRAPVPKPYAGTNLIHIGRQDIYDKLNSIRLENVTYDRLPLPEVLSLLSAETRRRDPKQRGINFIVNNNTDTSAGAAASAPAIDAVDPTTGLSRSAGTSVGPDLNTVSIRLIPALRDVSVANVLGAIVKAADQRIKYAIEDNGVVFSLKSTNEAPPLYVRIIKLDPNTFLQGLSDAVGLAQSSTVEEKQRAVREFVTSVGIDLRPPKSIFFNDREGTLMVRATLEDLDVIESAVQVLNMSPPLVNIKTKFIEIPEWSVTNFWKSLGTSGVGGTDLTTILRPAQAGTALKALTSIADADLLSEISVTTCSGRQAQVQSVDLKPIINVGTQALRLLGLATNDSARAAPDGPTLVPLGCTLDIVPVVANGWKIELTARADVTEFLGYYDDPVPLLGTVDEKSTQVTHLQLPRFRVRRVASSASVPDGCTLVLANPVDADGKAAEKSGDGKKRLIILVTPTIIDPAGNQLHTDEEGVNNPSTWYDSDPGPTQRERLPPR